MSEPISEKEIVTTPLTEKANNIYQKFNLTEITPNKDQIIGQTQQFIDKYQVPESFLKDDINLSLLLGCSEKLLGDSDTIYKQRIERFRLWLVEPSVPKGLIDVEGIWGSEPSRAELPREESDKYIAENTDPSATTEFLKKHQSQIEKCQQVWNEKKGINLRFKVSIIKADIMEFRTKLRSAGFIRTPDEDLKPGKDATIEMVLLKGYSAERDDMVNHELYHVEDVGNFIRRGREEHILESLDELHTEHAVGNYIQGQEDVPARSSYFTLKELWNRLSFLTDTDFDLLSDRKLTIETISSKFGLTGLVDFSLMFAHGDARSSIFDTFYGDYENVLMSMLVQKEKIDILKRSQKEKIDPDLENIHQQIGLLALRTIPPETYEPKRYKNIYEMFPTREGHTFGFTPDPNDPTREMGRLDNPETKQMYNAYTRALALAEVYYHHRDLISENQYLNLIDSLSQIPFSRNKLDFYLPNFIDNQTQDSIKYSGWTEEVAKTDAFQHLFYNLVNEMKPAEIYPQLENPQTRLILSKPILNEFSVMAKNILDYKNENYNTSFIEGFYRYRCNSDIREIVLRDIQEKFPQYIPVVEKFKRKFDQKKVANKSF